MGDVSVTARRLPDGHVEYGWSGNGGYFCNVGIRLLMWYAEDNRVEDLFHPGQTEHADEVGAERGDHSIKGTDHPARKTCSLGVSEREIFSRIAFVDYGYLRDLDHRWYYIVPGPFRIKMPLELVGNNLDEDDYEFDFLRKVAEKIAEYMFCDYIQKDNAFAEKIKEMEITPEHILDEICHGRYDALDCLYENYRPLFKYFDDWILIKSDDACKNITEIILKPKTEKHIETIEW